MNSKILLSSMILGLTAKILKYGKTSSTTSLNFNNFGTLVFQELDTRQPGSLVSTSHQGECFRYLHLNEFFDNADFSVSVLIFLKSGKISSKVLDFDSSLPLFDCLLDTLICLFHPTKFIESILLVSHTY